MSDYRGSISNHQQCADYRSLLKLASVSSLPKTSHQANALVHSKSSRSSFRLKKTLSSLSTIPTSPIISKVMSIGIIRSDMLPLRAKVLPMLPVCLRHAHDHLSEHEYPVHLVFLDRVPRRIALVIGDNQQLVFHLLQALDVSSVVVQERVNPSSRSATRSSCSATTGTGKLITSAVFAIITPVN